MSHMENIGTYNIPSNMIGSGNQNMYGAMNLGHEGRMVGYLPQGGLQQTEEMNIRSGVGSSQFSSTFTGLIPEQHYPLVQGGRLVVGLNIESRPSGANNFGPSGVRGPAAANDSSLGGQRCAYGRRTSPEFQGIGSMTPHVSSNSFGHNFQQSHLRPEGSQTEIRIAYSSRGVESYGNNIGGRIHHSRGGTPQRLITSVPGGSSGQILSHEPLTIAPMRATTFINAAAPTTASMGVAAPFRIHHMLARRDNFLQALIHSQPFAPVQHSFGSVLGQQCFHSPSMVAAPLSDAQGMTLGQTSNGQNNRFTQSYMQFSNLQPLINSQFESSLTSNVAQNFIVNPSQMVEHLHYQPSAGIFIGNLNQGQSVGPMMQPRFGVNRTNPRPNVQPTGNFLRGVNSNNQRDIMRAHGVTTVNNDNAEPRALESPWFYQVNEVIEISDDENDESDELDDMRLDIEEMTYEELLELEERMGAADAGLTEEAIMEGLRRRYYRAAKNRPPEAAESCCICLVEFENRAVLGKINCTHKFHFDCIKQWLQEKNFCPMCKQVALSPN